MLVYLLLAAGTLLCLPLQVSPGPLTERYRGATGLIYEEPECLARGGICRKEDYCPVSSEKVSGLCGTQTSSVR